MLRLPYRDTHGSRYEWLMSLFAVEQQFNGERSLVIEAETVVSAAGWRVFRNADERPPTATLDAGLGPVEALRFGKARAREWSRIDRAGEIRLRQVIAPSPPPRNQLFAVMMRRGRTSAVVIEAASAIATEERWVFRDAHGHSMAAAPAADVSHVETVRHRLERR